MQTAQRAGQRLSEVADAERAALTAERNITTALAAVSDEERRVAELDSARQALVLVEAYGRFRELRERVQVAARAGEDARREGRGRPTCGRARTSFAATCAPGSQVTRG